MFCISCGAQLPDEANFCWKCGKPQKPGSTAGASSQAEEPKWETCRIVFSQTHHGLLGNKGVFKVEATGPDGKHSVWTTPEFSVNAEPDRDNPAVQKIHRDLISHLMNDGWEATGERGAKWWENGFSRRVDSRPENLTPPEWLRKVQECLRAGNKIEAIKAYRLAHAASQVGLKEAKDAVEAIERELAGK